MSKRMAEVHEYTKKNLEARVEFLAVQMKMYRALSIIHAHHPKEARNSILQMNMRIFCGEMALFSDYENRLVLQAQKCGRSIGVFDDKGELCKGVTAASLWAETEKI